jgi:hypothetical protein
MLSHSGGAFSFSKSWTQQKIIHHYGESGCKWIHVIGVTFKQLFNDFQQ